MKLSIKRSINSLFQIDLWDLFYCKSNFDQFLKTKGKILKNNKKIHYKKNYFFADPFILKVKKNNIQLLVEDFSFLDGAKLSSINFNFLSNTLKINNLVKGKHFSYPFLFKNKKEIYLFPEMSEERQNIIFLKKNNKIKSIKNYLFGENVIDPTIIKYGKYYWLFCSFKNMGENKNLYLFYAKNIFDNWIAHPKNPILKNSNKARPAGSIILHKGKLYRPAQNFKDGYGSGLYLNLIEKLDKNDYFEKTLFKINPLEKKYNGIHHISFKDGYFVFDQKFTVYSTYKIIYYILKKIYFKNYIN